MMSGAKKRAPKRRFKEFLNAGDWEQRKLRNLLEQPITDGPHETPELYDSGIPFISVDAIVDNKIDFTKMRGYISKEYDDICAKKYKPQINDVYLVKSGATIGKVAIVETYDNFNIWSPLAAMRCGSITNPYFLYMLLQTPDLQSQVFNKASHGTQPNLSMRQLETFTCKVPKIEEQKLISRFLKQLDDVITLHQRKLDKLQATKKALLQEMFPEEGQDKPKRRFKGFTDAWEQRKLSDLMEVTSVKRIHQADWTDSGVRFFRARDIVSSMNNEEIDNPVFISKDKYEEYSRVSGKVIEGDLLVTGVGTIGVPYLIKDTTPLYFKDGNIIWFKNNNTLNGSYFYYCFQNSYIQNQIYSASGKGTVGTYTIENGKKTSIRYPSLKEQIKIGNLLDTMTTMITLHQHKLDKLKNLKQAYLNEMFV